MRWTPTFTTSRLLGLLLSLGLAGCSAGPGPAAAFRQANEQLRQGHYAQAIQQYQHLERQGVEPAALYCNLGNACYQSGRVGWAIYYYEKALRLTPFDAQLLANRRAVRPRGVAEEPPPLLKREWTRKAADTGTAVAAVGCLCSGMLFFAAVVQRRKHRRLLALCQYLLAAAALLLLVGGLVFSWPSRRIAIVVVPTTTARSGPSSAASRAFVVGEGEEVRVEREYQSWLKIRTKNGEAGWIPARSGACLAP